MIIAIAGLSGSGKNTLGELLAKELGYRLVCPTFKDLAAREGVSLMEFQKKAERDHDIDRKFDEVLREQAKGDCVVTTWLGPWILEADVRIKVFAPLEVRAGRLGKRDGIKDARKHITERDESNRKRYLKVYGIDIYDDSRFDALLNSGIYKPEELLKIALAIIDAKGEVQKKP
ncbi:MAG TPA: cytidylate kinase family protein [Candidatus Bilamarchaeum sp.]|nr:cytidylate kinase family protein [Candidatus Bilamarchaeum sp.]